MNLAEQAEARSRDRAIVSYLAALILLLVAIARISVSDGSWFVIAGAAALSLTSRPFDFSNGESSPPCSTTRRPVTIAGRASPPDFG